MRQFASGGYLPPSPSPRVFFMVLFVRCRARITLKSGEYLASAGFARGCWRTTNPHKKKGLSSPLFRHFVSTVRVNLIVGALDSFNWLAIVPVSIADAICATVPFIEVSSLIGSSKGSVHFLPLLFDTTTVFSRRSIVTITECFIFVCRFAHRLGVLKGLLFVLC